MGKKERKQEIRFRTAIELAKGNILHTNWFLLLNGRVPTDSNHQIDGVVDRNDVPNQLRVDFESANETFADSGDES